MKIHLLILNVIAKKWKWNPIKEIKDKNNNIYNELLNAKDSHLIITAIKWEVQKKEIIKELILKNEIPYNL